MKRIIKIQLLTDSKFKDKMKGNDKMLLNRKLNLNKKQKVIVKRAVQQKIRFIRKRCTSKHTNKLC